MDYQSIITSNYDFFDQSNIWTDIMRSFGWGIVRFLTWLCNGAQEIFDSAYNMLNFTSSDLFKNYLSEFSVWITVILTISFISLGLIYVFSEKKPQVLRNVMIAIAVIYIIPEAVETMNAALISSKNGLLTESYTTQTVLSNVTDLNYVGRNGFSFDSTIGATISDNSMALQAVDVQQHLKPSSFDTDEEKAVFGHYITIDDSGNTEWKEFESKGMFDVFDPPYYYRYKVQFLSIFLLLIANILVFLFGGYAVVRMIWEIAIGRIITALASMELSNGQKTIKVLEGLFNAYLVIFGIPVMLKMYLIWQQYVNTNNSNGYVKTFLIVFAAFVVIDGPSFIEKHFGYDMGLSLGSQKIMAFMRTAQQVRSQHHMSHNGNNHTGTMSKIFAATKNGYKNSSGVSSEPISKPKNSSYNSQNTNSEPRMNNTNGKQNMTQKGTYNSANLQNTSSNNSRELNGGAIEEPTMHNTQMDLKSDISNNIPDNSSVNNAAMKEPDVGIKQDMNKAGTEISKSSTMGKNSNLLSETRTSNEPQVNSSNVNRNDTVSNGVLNSNKNANGAEIDNKTSVKQSEPSAVSEKSNMKAEPGSKTDSIASKDIRNSNIDNLDGKKEMEGIISNNVRLSGTDSKTDNVTLKPGNGNPINEQYISGRRYNIRTLKNESTNRKE